MNREAHGRSVFGTSLILALMFIGFQPKAQAQAANSEHANVAKVSKQHFVEAYGKLPLAFEANTGQTSDEVKFLSRGQGYTLFLARNAETVLVLSASSQKEASERPPNTRPARFKPRRESAPPWVVRMELVNADVSSQGEGLEELPGKANYFIGNDPSKWRTNVPLFSRVQYRNVYPGVDLVYYGNQTQLENDFIVAPGADPQSITLRFIGAEKLSLDSQGNLILAAKEGEVRFQKPRIYQDVNGTQHEISGDYLLKDVHQVGFQVAAYDHSRPLIIDPVLSYSTYLGGSMGSTAALYTVVDGGGNAFITGFTYATDFPTTPGVFHTTPPSPCSGCAIPSSAVFVTELNPEGSAPVFSTYVGGSAANHVAGIAIDAAEDVYITGYTDSADFPTTPGAFQTVFLGNTQQPVYNAFVTKLNPAGSALLYSTYLGSAYGASASGIAIDGASNAYVSGSAGQGFPTTAGAFQTAYRGANPYSLFNAFVSKLNPSGSALAYSTYIGGSIAGNGIAQSTSVAVDASLNAYITGFSYSANFPTTLGAFDPVFPLKQNQSRAAFVTKLSADGSTLIYSTFLGGAGDDAAYGIALDTQDNAYVAGTTSSTNFPTTPGAFQSGAFQPAVPLSPPASSFSSFVTKLNPSGSQLVYSTYLNGSKFSYTQALALDSAGDAFVLGSTNSSDFPTTPDAMQPAPSGIGFSSYITALNPAGSALMYSSYFGSGVGAGFGIAVDPLANAYIVGQAASGFPTTPNAFQPTNPGALNGWASGFAVKITGITGLAPAAPAAASAAPHARQPVRSATGQLQGGRDALSSFKNERTFETAKSSSEESRSRAVASFGRLPLSFEANQGQTDSRMKFLARGQGYTLFLTHGGEAVLTLAKRTVKRDSLRSAAPAPVAEPESETETPSAVVRMSLAGANRAPQLEGTNELPGKANYFIGNDPSKWRTNVPTYARVNFHAIYPGVDLAYYGNQQQLEYDFIVEPGADSHFITMNFSGAQKLSLDAQGDLVLRIANRDLRLLKPVAYQEVDGRKRAVASSYELKSARQVSFHVAAYDHSRPLIIDPVLAYSTYLSGSTDGQNLANAIAVDPSGNAYITGFTQSATFPTTIGAFQMIANPCVPGSGLGGGTCDPSIGDAYVTKLNPTGSALVYSTYLGGSHHNDGRGIAVDAIGNVYVTGATDSSDFPTTPGALQTVFATPTSQAFTVYNGFVTELNPSGSALVYSTYLGGNGGAQSQGVAVDSGGNAYIAGSAGMNFPTTSGAFQSGFRGTVSGQSNAFVAKLNLGGSQLVYSTYVGGSGLGPTGSRYTGDHANGIGVDSAGNAYIAGSTSSVDFPTTLLAFQEIDRNTSGLLTGFVTKVNPTGSALIYSTFLGGSGPDDEARGLAVDAAGNAYVTGFTRSIDFPTTPGAFQSTAPGGADSGPSPLGTSLPPWNAFVTKLSASGMALAYSTYLGGSNSTFGAGSLNEASGIAVDSAGRAFLTGDTNAVNFPTTADALQPTAIPSCSQCDFHSGFVTVIDPQGAALVYSSYLGGTDGQRSAGNAIALDGSFSAYVAGLTDSTNFPTTVGAFQTAKGANGWTNAFVAKFSGFPTAP